jgi:hypothetical protein
MHIDIKVKKYFDASIGFFHTTPDFNRYNSS